MMENKNIIWLVVIPVSIAFAVVSVLLWLSGGNNKSLVSRKLKLGALIIGITGVMGGCRPPIVTCYKPAMIPQVIPVQQVTDGKISVESGFQNLEFDCEMIYDEHVSWIIYSKSMIVEKGNCTIKHTDSGLKLLVDPINDFAPGLYNLGLFNGKIDALGEAQIPFKEFEIEVIKK
jgi:hypothetical protein